MNIPKPKEYIKKFEKLGFGMFVHFGLYSLLESGEWTAKLNGVPENEYKALMQKFDPQNISDIVKTAKSGGAKYIVITTRHHDGFSLYDTCGLNDFDAPHSAARRDIIAEFVDECRKNDIIPFFYHTTLEFWNKEFDIDFKAYLSYLRESIKILCTKYGKVGGFWFDGNWSKVDEDWEEDKLYGLIRKYQPEAMIINNTGLNKLGEIGNQEIDSVTFERGKPFLLNRDGAEKYVAAEVCDSVNNHWGIAKDVNYKSSAQLIKKLCESRKVGANFLLNVGPDANGTVPNLPKALFEVIGEWIDVFGEAIYDAKPYWLSDDTDNFVLKNGNNLYFFCYDLCRRGSENVVYAGGKEGNFVFDGFKDKIKEIHWMDNDEKLDFYYNQNDLTVNFTGYDYGSDWVVRVGKATIQ